MKIHIRKVHTEYGNGEGRCSDGWYTRVDYVNTVKIFTDIETVKLSLCKLIIDFIELHTNSYSYEEFGGWSEDSYIETFDLESSNEFKLTLQDHDFVVSEIEAECPFLLNSIAKETIELHKSIIKELKEKQSAIYNKYISDLEDCKIETARRTYYSNQDIYDYNEIMLDFDLYPLDIAKQSDDLNLLDTLISNGANAVSDVESFAIWLCEKGKFEYLNLFVNIKERKLTSRNSSDEKQNENYGYGDKLLISFLLNTIAYNKPELFFEYGKLPNGKYPFRLCVNNYSESFSIGIGHLALNKSSNDTIKTLAEYNMGFFFFSNKIAEGCFKDKELAVFFVNKAPSSSLYTLFKAGRTDIIKELIEMNCFDFSEVYLLGFSPFFKPENDNFIKYIAFKASKPLTTRFFNLSYIYNKCEDEYYDSVLEQYIKLKRFLFAKQLFDISNTKERISSSDACRLLFILFENDDKCEAIEFKSVLLDFILEEDLFSLMIISWMLHNEQLFIFLIPLIKDINAPINEKNFRSFGMKISDSIFETFRKNKDGSFLHLIAASGIRFNHELFQKIINAGIDKTIKNSEGKVAYDCISYMGFGDSLICYLSEILYIEGCKICHPNGTLMCNSNLPIIKKFKNYTEKGINAVTAYKTNNKEALDFFISCGAEINRLKAEVESEIKRKNSKNISQNTEFIDDTSPTREELDDMYRDAFDGNPDAVWNID